jgi:NAD(P) transhydrogenase subunit alpha
MANETTQQVLDKTQQALKTAIEALQGAQTDIQHTADAAGAAAHAASGGIIDPFIFRLAIFALAVCVGYYVVWAVTPALHTPLMSVTNAISSVIVVGALLSLGVGFEAAGARWARIFGFVAVTLACVNIFGGFLVTERMLAMYKRRGDAK